MRCLVVTCVYPPEPVVSARTSRDVAAELARAGHAVTVLAPFPNRPAGRVYPGHRRRFADRRMEDGIEVVRSFSFLSRGPGFASRFFESASFALTAGWQALRARRPDAIYSNTWPILGTAVVLAVCRLRGARLVVNVQDLYPESLASQGRLSPESRLLRWLRALDGAIARRCDRLFLVSDRFLPAYRDARRVPAAKLEVLPNWTDEPAALPPDEEVARFRSACGLPPDAFVVGYGGNIGTAAGVEGLIEAFAASPPSSARLLVAGEGSNLAACRELAARLAPGRVHFRSPWPAEETAVALRAADLLAIPTLAAQSEVSVPSKLMSCLLAGRPVLAVALPGSALAAAVERSGAGWVVPPEDARLLSAKLAELAALDRSQLLARGAAGLAFGRREFAPGAGPARIVAALEQAASGGGARP